MAALLPRSPEAVKRAIAVYGSQAAMAEDLSCSQPTISDMARGIKPVPSEMCPLIEKGTRARGHVVSCEELRPDVHWSVLRANALEWV